MFYVTIYTITCKFVDYLKFKTHKEATNYLKEHGFVYDSAADPRYASYIPDNWFNSKTKCEANILSYCC